MEDSLPTVNSYNEENTVFQLPVTSAHETVQWPSSALSSTSYGNSWAPLSLVGPPRVYPKYGDIGGSWAPQNPGGTVEWLVLNYDHVVFLTGIDIFETYHVGAVVKITATTPEKSYVLWEAVAGPEHDPTPASRIFSPELNHTMIRANQIRLDLDCRQLSSWAEIDTVALRGVQYVAWSPESHKLLSPAMKNTLYGFLLAQNRLPRDKRLPIELLTLVFNHVIFTWPTRKEIEIQKSEDTVNEEVIAEAESVLHQTARALCVGRRRLLASLLSGGNITQSVQETELEKLKDKASMFLEAYELFRAANDCKLSRRNAMVLKMNLDWAIDNKCLPDLD